MQTRCDLACARASPQGEGFMPFQVVAEREVLAWLARSAVNRGRRLIST